MNNVVMCFIIPPPLERLHSSWRGIVYTRKAPEKVFVGRRTLPSKIEPDLEIMKQELCDPDHIPAHVVQLTSEEQYIYIEGDVCQIIGTEVHMADGHNDPYLKNGAAPVVQQPNKSSLVLPGQPGNSNTSAIGNIITTSAQAASMGATGPTNLEDCWIVDVTFKTHPEKDPDVINRVKAVAWSHGLSL